VKVEEEIGEVYKVRIGFEEQDGDKSWYLDTVSVQCWTWKTNVWRKTSMIKNPLSADTTYSLHDPIVSI
jgi:hypothetical protein